MTTERESSVVKKETFAGVHIKSKGESLRESGLV